MLWAKRGNPNRESEFTTRKGRPTCRFLFGDCATQRNQFISQLVVFRSTTAGVGILVDRIALRKAAVVSFAQMSLSLVQDYSSEEEGEEEELLVSDNDHWGSGEDDEREQQPTPSDDVRNSGMHSSRISESVPPKAGSSLLPSPEDLFSEVTGPPEFLKSSATEPLYARVNHSWQPSSGQPLTPVHRSDPVTDSAPVVVLEISTKSSGSHKPDDSENGTRDGKEIARSAAGLGAPVRENISAPPRLYIGADMKNSTTDAEKRNRSKIKDKEKNKRMKGQSSHATWKTETEMQLRQQFD